MQRMLVILVVFLVAAVALLGMTVYDLKESVAGQRDRIGSIDRSGARLPPPEPRTADDTRVAALERRIDSLNREINRLKARPVVRPADGAAPSTSDGTGSEPIRTGSLAGRAPDANGEFDITPEDEAFFTAVQERIQYKRRIDGMAQNVIRRVERLATRGEIGALDEPTKEKLGTLIRGYVVSSDDIANRYLRKPNEEMKQKSANERRDMMAAERDRLVEIARQELVPLVGAADAEKVANESIQSPWGLRYRDRSRPASPRRRNR